jgi:hypothetical protein
LSIIYLLVFETAPRGRKGIYFLPQLLLGGEYL